MISGNEVLTAKQVGQILNLHPSTLYKLTRQGKIPGFRIGSDWRFRADVIERWIEAQSTDVSH